MCARPQSLMHRVQVLVAPRASSPPRVLISSLGNISWADIIRAALIVPVSNENTQAFSVAAGCLNAIVATGCECSLQGRLPITSTLSMASSGISITPHNH
jgi:hypothetical protein